MEQLVVGSQLGPYRIEGSLGSGGMGRVYKARDTHTTAGVRVVALDWLARLERRAGA